MLAKALLYTCIYIYVHTVFCIHVQLSKTVSYVMSLLHHISLQKGNTLTAGLTYAWSSKTGIITY